MRLDDHSQPYTTVNTHRGLYRYTRLPYGVACAPAKFPKALEQVLHGLEGVGVYIDDLLVTGDTIEAHLNNLENVLTRLREHGLKLQKSSVVSFSPLLSSWGSALMFKKFMSIQPRWNALRNALSRKRCPNYCHSWAWFRTTADSFCTCQHYFIPSPDSYKKGLVGIGQLSLNRPSQQSSNS